MMFPTLQTERLDLIEVGTQHKQRYFEIMSNDVVTKYYGMDSLNNLEQAEKIIQSFKQTYESDRGLRWAIIWKESGAFVGTIGFNNLNKWSKKAEIGYELDPAYWRKGITTEAVKEVLRYSFEKLDLFRMGAITFPDNESSTGLLKKLGFKEEGHLRGYLYQNQQSHDALVFSLLRTEWENE